MSGFDDLGDEGLELDNYDRVEEQPELAVPEPVADTPNPEATPLASLAPENGGSNAATHGQPAQAQGDGQDVSKAGKIFIGGLSWDTTEDKLREHFGVYGELADVVVMKDRATERPRGFGFVTFADPSIMESVVKDTHTLDGRVVEAKISVPKDEMAPGKQEADKPKSKKIFVGGLSPETTDAEFRTYFEKYGRITESQIMQGARAERGP
mmetsp:Transcript_2224/g.7929  ORF Transcript_2224/g.7929 Transcript_2224/m.7929 type:complete len:210 (+) Transcript_2224:24-653(+)